jgi:hypothetical protein
VRDKKTNFSAFYPSNVHNILSERHLQVMPARRWNKEHIVALPGENTAGKIMRKIRVNPRRKTRAELDFPAETLLSMRDNVLDVNPPV